MALFTAGSVAHGQLGQSDFTLHCTTASDPGKSAQLLY